MMSGKPSILVVDDEPTMRDFLKSSLKDRYQGQLMAYRMLLAGVTGRPVSSEIWALSTSERVII